MIILNDVFAFALHQRLFGQEVINTFALKVTQVVGDYTETEFIDLCFANATGKFNAAGQLRQLMLPLQADALTHEKWTAQRVQGVLSGVFERALSSNVTGTDLADCDTANVAGCISRRGAAPGRRNKGRIAIAGITVNAAAEGLLSAGWQSDAALLAVKLRGELEIEPGLTVTMGFWSPTHTGMVGGLPVVYPAQFVAVVDTTVRNTVRVQRSRTIGVGS